METSVYLDFDGVLNSFNYNPQLLKKKTGFEGWAKSIAFNGHFSFMTSYTRNLAVRDLAERDDVNFVWLTTWWQDPESVEYATKIEGYPFYDRSYATVETWTDKAKADRNRFSAYEWMAWKADVVASWQKPSDRFVWVDDDAIPKGFQREHPNALLVRPSATFGLNRQQYDSIVDYVSASQFAAPPTLGMVE